MFLLILLSAIVHVSFLFSPPEVVVSEKDGLINFLTSPMKNWPSLFLSFLYHLIILIQALRLNYILQNEKMLPRTYLPAMTYILCTAVYPLWNNITPGLIINFFVIWLVGLFLRLSHAENKVIITFNIGFVAGFCALFYPPSLMLIPAMLISIFTFATFNIRLFLIYILGVVLPVYFAAALFYLTDSLSLAIKYIPDFGWYIPQFKDSIELIIAFSILAVLAVLGLMKLPFGTMLIAARKGWSVLLIMMAFLAAGIILLEDHSLEALMIITVPAASIASGFFIYNKSKVISALFFWIVLLACWYVIWAKYFFK